MVLAIPRWDLEPDEWGERLDKYGFVDIEHQVIAPPAATDSAQPTILMRAVRPEE
ncbi:hypothetical protein [Catellatospora chokoriensis]|uniref:Uncharacterized protein n=1 Tax=Catellatospora chokoriensis TaxID=310353 RepID=A0A8J3NTB5_9ACTN|nr:hypothetical protein [Catellatospora chokoriensis]GIF91498.1 hypothetical protein Cch02nite_49420 [Catellatospora chokoriensis]